MASPYNIFNKQLKTFFRECDRTFPDLMCFKFIIGGYKFLKSMNKKLPQKYFQELFIIPHAEAVSRRSDETIFSDSYVPPVLYASVINTLKATWQTLDEATKNTIYDHLGVLITLNEKCIEYRRAKKMPPIECCADDAIENDD